MENQEKFTIEAAVKALGEVPLPAYKNMTVAFAVADLPLFMRCLKTGLLLTLCEAAKLIPRDRQADDRKKNGVLVTWNESDFADFARGYVVPTRKEGESLVSAWQRDPLARRIYQGLKEYHGFVGAVVSQVEGCRYSYQALGRHKWTAETFSAAVADVCKWDPLVLGKASLFERHPTLYMAIWRRNFFPEVCAAMGWANQPRKGRKSATPKQVAMDVQFAAAAPSDSHLDHGRLRTLRDKYGTNFVKMAVALASSATNFTPSAHTRLLELSPAESVEALMCWLNIASADELWEKQPRLGEALLGTMHFPEFSHSESAM